MVKTKTRTAKRASNRRSCTHHWLLDAVAGPRSIGVCRNCGAKREFMNQHGTKPDQ